MPVCPVRMSSGLDLHVEALLYARSMLSFTHAAVGFLVILLASSDAATQWLQHPSAGAPRNADGAVDMSAPAPRMADGKPDFSGIWTTAEPNILPAGVLSSPAARNTV